MVGTVIEDALLALAGIAGIVAVVLGLMWVTGNLDGSPAERAGYPDPPPVCERGELPKRIYLSRGDTVMTCRIPELPR